MWRKTWRKKNHTRSPSCAVTLGMSLSNHYFWLGLFEAEGEEHKATGVKPFPTVLFFRVSDCTKQLEDRKCTLFLWFGGAKFKCTCPLFYRAWVLSSMGSPLVSGCPSASGGLSPFSVASLSDRPRMRGNNTKSYSRAPMAPPIIGPTQYTCQGKTYR